MYYDSFLPFLRDSVMVKNTSEFVDIDQVLCPIVSNKDTSYLDNSVIVNNMTIKVFKVLPLNIYVFNMSDVMSLHLKQKYAGQSKMVDVTYLDYSYVAKNIEVSGELAKIAKNEGYLVEDIQTEVLINYSANDSEINIDRIIEEKPIVVSIPDRINVFDIFQNEGVVEALDFDSMMNSFGGGTKADIKTKATDFIYSWLDGYFQIPEDKEMEVGGREVVPLLIGPTGVFKSATVKELCDKYGYRLVDFRVAFTSRVDFSGLFHIASLNGQDVSYACPMEEIVTCSDGFRDYCARAVAVIKDILVKGEIVTSESSVGSQVTQITKPLDNEMIDKLNKMIELYSKYLPTPVLFFDEITRNKDKGVEGVLVTLLNQKRFNNMTLTRCKFVAATNLNLSNPALDDVYQVDKEIDTAYSNRFMPLKVYPTDVAGRWFDWGSSINVKSKLPNIHPEVIKYLQTPANKSEVYNDNYLVDVWQKTNSDEEVSATPFPNYRTWELVSVYLNKVDTISGKKFKARAIDGLLNEIAGARFRKFISSDGYTEETELPDADDVGSFMETSLDAGLPTMLIGPSSLGKTGRVNDYADKNGAEVIHINLASKESVDVMGMPKKVKLNQYVVGDMANSPDFKVLSTKLKNIVDDIQAEGKSGLVDMLTIRAPETDFAKKIQDFMKPENADKQLILFFDECNRVTNESLMSAMFEAVSDSRIFGVNFKAVKDRVKVVAACNLITADANMGTIYNAKKLDTALAARFNIYWKKKYDVKDAASFKKFLRKKVDAGKIDPIIPDYLDTLTDDKLVDFMKRIEVRQIENAEPSSRALLQLSQDIKNMRGSKMWSGCVLFNDAAKSKVVSLSDKIDDPKEDVNVKIQLVRDICDLVRKRYKNWTAFKNNEVSALNGQEGTAGDFIKMLFDGEQRLVTGLAGMTIDNINKMLTLMRSIIDVLNILDNKVVELNKSAFTAYAGPDFASQFLSFFNERFGTNKTIITIPELTDESLIADYVSQEISSIGAVVDKKIAAMLVIIKNFEDYWKDTLPPINYSELISALCDSLPTSDNVLMLLTKMGKGEDLLMSMSEKVGDNFIKNVLARAGYNVTDTDIQVIRQASGGPNTGSSNGPTVKATAKLI